MNNQRPQEHLRQLDENIQQAGSLDERTSWSPEEKAVIVRHGRFSTTLALIASAGIAFAQTAVAEDVGYGSLSSQSQPPTNQLENGPGPDQWVSNVWERFVAEGPTGDEIGDFSYAGYARGEKEIPDVPVVVNAADHGAVASDGQDDTKAIEAAIAAAHAAGGGAVLLPNGQLDVGALGRGLEVTHSNIVIRGGGSGPEGTIINLTDPLEKGAAINLVGEKWPKGESKLATGISPIVRGAFELEVDDASAIEAGMKLRVLISVPEGSTLMGEVLTSPFQLDPEVHTSTLTRHEIHWFAEVVGVPSPTTVRLAQPFRIDVPTGWTVTLFTHGMIEEVGVERLRIDTDWPGQFRHHKPHGEPGDPDYRSKQEQDYYWPGVKIEWAWNGWMRDVVVANTNWSISHSNSTAWSLLELRSEGHAGHAFVVMGGHDCLIVNPVLQAPTCHTFYFGNRASGNVVTGAVIDFEPDVESGVGRQLDFHGMIPVENLCERVRDAYVKSGGPKAFLPHSGIRNVFWDVRSPADRQYSEEFLLSGTRGSLGPKAFEQYPQSFLVGVHRAGESRVFVEESTEDRSDEWLTIEGLNREGVFPASLYGAQLELRLRDKEAAQMRTIAPAPRVSRSHMKVHPRLTRTANVPLDIFVPHSSPVSLKIYDLSGRVVVSIIEEHCRSGHYRMAWNAASVPAGWYTARLQVGEQISAETITFVE